MLKLRFFALFKVRYLILIFLLCCNSLIVQAYELYEGKGFKIYLGVNPKNQIISLAGHLNASKSEIEEANYIFSQINPKKKIILSLSNYYGGDISAAENFVKILKKNCEANIINAERDQSCKFDTYVSNDTTCGSSCIIPFMAGEKRISCPAGYFGFHSQSLNFGLFSVLRSPEKSLKKLKEIGVDPDWVNKNSEMFTSNEATYKLAKNLTGSNILTEIDTNCDYIERTAR